MEIEKIQHHDKKKNQEVKLCYNTAEDAEHKNHIYHYLHEDL